MSTQLQEIREEGIADPHSPSDSPGVSPTLSYRVPTSVRPKLPHNASSVSRVEIGFFDPHGVSILRRTLTDLPAFGQVDDECAVDTLEAEKAALEGDNFDFEKALRNFVKR